MRKLYCAKNFLQNQLDSGYLKYPLKILLLKLEFSSNFEKKRINSKKNNKISKNNLKNVCTINDQKNKQTHNKRGINGRTSYTVDTHCFIMLTEALLDVLQWLCDDSEKGHCSLQ